MLKSTKAVLLSILALTTLASCGAAGEGKSAAKLENAFLSPSTLTYQNMRPTYNYYLTTFTFEALEIYDDNTYALSVHSSQFSGLILPEEGNAIQGNERANSVTTYFGKFTSKVDEIDPDGLQIKCEIPTRITLINDSTYFVDTDNWTEDMKTKSAITKVTYNTETGAQSSEVVREFNTGAEYLEYFTWSKSVEFFVSKAKNSLEYKELPLIPHKN